MISSVQLPTSMKQNCRMRQHDSIFFCGRQLLTSYSSTLQSPEAQKQIEPQDKDP